MFTPKLPTRISTATPRREREWDALLGEREALRDGGGWNLCRAEGRASVEEKREGREEEKGDVPKIMNPR